MPRLPSEYAREQVFIGASFHARFEAEDAIANGYEDRVIWGSDYPHFEGTYQYDADRPERRADDVGVAAVPLRRAARRAGAAASSAATPWHAYDLDYDALTKVAARINAPTYDDLNSEPVDERPPGSGHLAFRTFGFWA